MSDASALRTLLERVYYHLAIAIGGLRRESIDVTILKQLVTSGVRGRYIVMDQIASDIQYRLNLVLNPYVDLNTPSRLFTLVEKILSKRRAMRTPANEFLSERSWSSVIDAFEEVHWGCIGSHVVADGELQYQCISSNTSITAPQLRSDKNWFAGVRIALRLLKIFSTSVNILKGVFIST